MPYWTCFPVERCYVSGNFSPRLVSLNTLNGTKHVTWGQEYYLDRVHYILLIPWSCRQLAKLGRETWETSEIDYLFRNWIMVIWDPVSIWVRKLPRSYSLFVNELCCLSKGCDLEYYSSTVLYGREFFKLLLKDEWRTSQFSNHYSLIWDSM